MCLLTSRDSFSSFSYFSNLKNSVGCDGAYIESRQGEGKGGLETEGNLKDRSFVLMCLVNVNVWTMNGPPGRGRWEAVYCLGSTALTRKVKLTHQILSPLLSFV